MKHGKRSDIKVGHCFFRTDAGKCSSPEIYRFVPNMETGNDCPFGVDLTAFLPDGKLRCLEFRHVMGVASKGEKRQT